MRQRTQKNLFDNIFWYLIYLLPIIIWIVVSFRTGTIISLSTALDTMGLKVLDNNQIIANLSEIFGNSGVIPMFASADVLLYMAYFISVYLIHLFVDFLLFIPRIAHKWLNKLYGGDN